MAGALALASPAAALAAGGMPMPGPDDPPGPAVLTTQSVDAAPATAAPTRAKVVSPAKVVSRSTKPTVESTVPVPSPDAPLAAVPVRVARAPVTSGTSAPVPEVAHATHSTPVVPRTPVTSRAAPPVTLRTARAPATPKAKPKSRPGANPGHNVGKSEKPAAATKRPAAPAPPRSTPRDVVRLGLPVAALAPRPPGGDGMNGTLLVAAALLLAAAAGGSLLLSVAARNVTRHA